MVFAFKGMIPVVDPTSFVHPQATLIGHVTIGPDCYVGPHAVLRGDWGKIVLERGCNVQEGCVIHMFPGETVRLEEGAHVGHGAMIHGATLERNCMIGMNAVILDGAVIGSESVVGALTLVKSKTKFERRSLVLGNPAVRKGEVSDEMIAHKNEGTALYQALPMDCHSELVLTEPLTNSPDQRPEAFPTFETWQSRKAKAAGTS